MNVNTALSTLTAAAPAATVATATGTALPALGTATAARDAAMPDYADASASTNSLQAIAALLAGQSPNTAALDASSASDVAPPALPSAVDHGSHNESALGEDLGLDDPTAGASQASISA